MDPLQRKFSDTQSILMYHSVVKVIKNRDLEFTELSLKVASAYMLPQSSDICLRYAKQKHQECKKKCEAYASRQVQPKALISAEAK